MAGSNRGKGTRVLGNDPDCGAGVSSSANEGAEMSTYSRRAKRTRTDGIPKSGKQGKSHRVEAGRSELDGNTQPSTTRLRIKERPTIAAETTVVEEKDDRVQYLTSRCTPTRFARTIEKLNGEQRSLVGSLGLGGLLHVQPVSLGMQLIHQIARFDVGSFLIRVHGKQIPFGVEEVGRILGITNCGIQAPAAITREEEDDIRGQYNLPVGEIKLGVIECNLHELNGNEFKAKFILYAISTLMNPPTGLRVSPKFLAIIRDIEGCKNINWARFTYEGLVDGVRHLKDAKTEQSMNKYITGCILLLQLWYLERLSVPESVNTPLKIREVPRMKHWNAKATTKLMDTVSRISDDLDDDKIIMLDEDLVGDDMDKGERANMAEKMAKILRQQEELMSRQDSIVQNLTSLREELLGSVNAKLDRLRDDLCNLFEEKMRKMFGDLGRRSGSPKDTENIFSQRMKESDDQGGDDDLQRFRDREMQFMKPSFYENLALLDISTEGVIPITIGKSSKQAPKKDLNVEDEGQAPIPANLGVEEAAVGPSRGIRMTLRPSTARHKGPTNVTGQASASSFVALVTATRESKRPGIRRKQEIKKGLALHSPYDQPKTSSQSKDEEPFWRQRAEA